MTDASDGEYVSSGCAAPSCAGGGGGSYYDPAFNDVTFGLNGNGNGVFTVAVVTPAPNAFPVFWSGLGALGLALRKRRERDLRKVRAG